MEVLKVSANTEVKSLAGAIAGWMREENGAELQAIGAGAVNTAIKAIAVARGFMAPTGIELVCTPCFAEVEIEGKIRTVIKLRVSDRRG